MADHSRILVRRGDRAWATPEVSAYRNEAHLQVVIRTDPGRIPGVQDDALAVEELPTSGGWADVCIVGRDGSVTVVECKLASNPEKRRMVLGQVLDYAAGIWNDGPDTFLEAWTGRGGPDLRTELDADALAQLRRNVSDGRIDLCLAVDLIDDDLQRLVEYLNLATRDDVRVTAIQLVYASHEGVEILVSSTFGGELAEAKVRTSHRGESWTWETFLAALVSESDRKLAVDIRKRLDELGNRRGEHELVWFGSKPNGGVFFHPYGLRYAPIQLWINGAGRLMLFGNWRQYGEPITHHDGFAPLAELLGQSHLNVRKGVRVDSLPLDQLWATILACADAINEHE